MLKPRLRKPRFERCPGGLRLVLTERDVSILSLIDRYRLIRSAHLLRLVRGSRQHLIRRLGKLFHAGYLDRPDSQRHFHAPFHAPLVYSLASKGDKELHRHGIPAPTSIPRRRAETSALFLSHALRVTDVLVAFEASAITRRWRFVPHHEWNQTTDAASLRHLRWFLRFRHEGRAIRTSVIPDAAFALEAPSGEHSYFLLEVDRGTMPVCRRDFRQSSFLRKVIAYKETRRIGTLWRRFQIPGFRVLIVAESARRLASLQAATAECFARGESSMFLFAVAADLLSAPNGLEHSWQTCSGEKQSLTA